MKTLIAYTSKYGCTKKCATMLSEKLNGEVTLHDLKRGKDISIASFDKVVVGGSFYMGSIQKEVKEFCAEHLKELESKPIALFICCMKEGEEAQAELDGAFPSELSAKAIAKEYLGGEFIFKKMNFLDRLIVKKVVKIEKDVSTLSIEKVDKLAEVLNQ